MVPGLSLRTILTIAAVLTALAALAYAYHAGHEKAALEAQVREAVTYAEGQRLAREAVQDNLNAVNAANAANAERAGIDQKMIEKLMEDAHATPDNPNRCLDADAARRVRDIR